MSYFTNCFQTNINDVKPIKIIPDLVPSTIIKNNITLNKFDGIANAFNKYFSNISSTIESTMKFFRSKFHDFLSDIEVIFLSSQLIKRD